jgi:aerobic-type carbon monoxide dehydrogenase small subunit (CoxS/CutS family)
MGRALRLVGGSCILESDPLHKTGPDMRKVPASFRVNGRVYEVLIPPNRLLVDLLREDLGLTGTKVGCDDGSCGACTVLVGGVPMQSCMMLALCYQDVEITTVEGLVDGTEMDIVQRAFLEMGGSQCGFCTPGLVLSVRALLNRVEAPTPEDIRQAIAGNLCRCTGYTKVLDAIAKALEWAREHRRTETVGSTA